MAHCGKGLSSGFKEFFASIKEVLILGGLGAGLIILWGLGTFLVFPKILSRSATRGIIWIYHVYKK